MNRPVLASAVLLSAALATAGCGGGTSSSAASSGSSTASSPASGTQSYASMLDLDAAVNGDHIQCSNVTMVPTTVAKAQATCDLGAGKQLVLQLWRSAASRDAGVDAIAAARTSQHLGYCVVTGTGPHALWSVDASADRTVCSDVARRLGGRVHQGAGATS